MAKKSTVKKKDKKNEVEVIEEMRLPTLTDVERLQLELSLEQKCKSESELKTIQKELENVDLEIINIELKKERLINKKQNILQRHNRKNVEISKKQKDYSAYFKMLTKKYKLADRWGFDPLTGEITEIEG